MTADQIRGVVVRYREKLAKKGLIPQQLTASIIPTADQALRHAAFVCEEIAAHCASDRMPLEAAHRHLGFVQGILWITGQRTFLQMHDDNRKG